MKDHLFATLIQRFFTEHLRAQRDLSPQTVAAYRDTFRLFLPFLSEHLHRPIDQLGLSDFSAEHVLAFLGHLERVRSNCVRTRNARLAGLRSFGRFALAHAGPEFLEAGHRILAVPMKRSTKPLLGFLTRDEIKAILAACNDNSWIGRRDRAVFTLLYNTGARVSEITALRAGDIQGEIVCLHGKGRKDRAVPLWPQTRRMLQQWIRTNQIKTDQPLFSNARGIVLTRAGIAFRLARAVQRAVPGCPALKRKGISPHTFRHSTALHLLQSGVALEVIALWLGHESPTTTHNYIEADLKMKADVLRALESPPAPPQQPRRAQPQLLAFLEAM